MEEQNLLQHLRLTDMLASGANRATPEWAVDSRTTLAHGSGRLPVQAQQIGWQPVAGPGSAPSDRPLSTSIQSLRRRVVRGEA